MAEDSSDSDSSDSSGHSASQRQSVRRVPLAAILEAKRENGGLTSIEFWKGQRPEQGSALFAHGFGLSNLTADVYIPVSSLKDTEEARQEKNSSKGHYRAPKDQRTFDHWQYVTDTGVPGSFLHGCQANRIATPISRHGMWGLNETLGDSLIPRLMKGQTRVPYRETVPRIVAKYGKDGRPKKCFITATGQDTCHEVPGYTRKVKVSKLSDKIDGISKNKKYIALGNYVPGNIQKLMDSRALGNHPGRPRPSQRPPGPAPGGGSKSRRRVKRRFKRKTIKRINKRNKRKTVKRRFKKR